MTNKAFCTCVRRAREEDLAQTEVRRATPGVQPEIEFDVPPSGQLIKPRAVRQLHGLLREHTLLHLQPLIGNRAVQRAIDRSSSSAAAIDDLAQRLRAASLGGRPIDTSARERLETSLDADLSAVKIHTDAEADHLSQALEARAFASGQDIFFREGQYQPNTTKGLWLLAHEATHTLQFSVASNNANPKKIVLSDASDENEHEANTTADRIIAGEHPSNKHALNSVGDSLLLNRQQQSVTPASPTLSKSQQLPTAKQSALFSLLKEEMTIVGNAGDQTAILQVLEDAMTNELSGEISTEEVEVLKMMANTAVSRIVKQDLQAAISAGDTNRIRHALESTMNGLIQDQQANQEIEDLVQSSLSKVARHDIQSAIKAKDPESILIALEDSQMGLTSESDHDELARQAAAGLREINHLDLAEQVENSVYSSSKAQGELSVSGKSSIKPEVPSQNPERDYNVLVYVPDPANNPAACYYMTPQVRELAIRGSGIVVPVSQDSGGYFYQLQGKKIYTTQIMVSHEIASKGQPESQIERVE